MRNAHGKGNDARKVLSYFSINFDINPPYQVLCDGPTIHQSLRNDIYLKQALPTLLGGTAYPVVTECIVNELRSLGEEFSSAAVFAKRLTRIPCSHEGVLSAIECVVDRVRTLGLKLLVATNDVEILPQVNRTPGVPLIMIYNQKKLLLKGPSRATIEFVHEREVSKTSALSDQDKALLHRLVACEAKEPVAKVPKKRKRAKGPNPLSVKKPKRARKNVANSASIRIASGDSLKEKELISSCPGVVSAQNPAHKDTSKEVSTGRKSADGSERADQTCRRSNQNRELRPTSIDSGKAKKARKRKRKDSARQDYTTELEESSNPKDERDGIGKYGTAQKENFVVAWPSGHSGLNIGIKSNEVKVDSRINSSSTVLPTPTSDGLHADGTGCTGVGRVPSLDGIAKRHLQAFQSEIASVAGRVGEEIATLPERNGNTEEQEREEAGWSSLDLEGGLPKAIKPSEKRVPSDSPNTQSVILGCVSPQLRSSPDWNSSTRTVESKENQVGAMQKKKQRKNRRRRAKKQVGS